MIKEDCIFCKIAAGEIPSSTLYEDDDVRVILDLGPASKGHMLILPKQHYKDLTELPEELGGKILGIAKKLGTASMECLGADGFNIIQNNKEVAGQTVMHFHMHVIPRYKEGPHLPLWNPGKLGEEEAKEILEKIKL